MADDLNINMLPDAGDNVEAQAEEYYSDKTEAEWLTLNPDDMFTDQPTTSAAPVETPEQAEVSGDPLHIRIFDDVTHGIAEMPRAVYHGMRDAAIETVYTLDELARYFNETTGLRSLQEAAANTVGLEAGDKKSIEETGVLEDVIPAVDNPVSFTGQAIETITQFVSGFGPLAKAARGLIGGVKIIKGQRALENALIGGVAQSISFDPHEDRLANLIETVPEISNPITSYLSADPSDTNAEGRIKNFLEGTGLGVIGEGLFQAVKLIKNARASKGAIKGITDDMAVPDEAVAKDITKRQEAITRLESEIVESSSPSVTLADGRVLRGKPGQTHADVIAENNLTDADFPNGEKHFNVYLHEGDPALEIAKRDLVAMQEGLSVAQAQAAEIAKQAALAAPKGAAISLRKVFDKTVEDAYMAGKGRLNDVFKSVNLGAIHSTADLDKTIKHAVNLYKVSKSKKPIEVDITDVEKLANRFGLKPEELIQKNPNLLKDPVAFTATVKLLDGTRKYISDLARVIVNDVDSAQSGHALYGLLKATNNYRAMMQLVRTGKSAAAEDIMAQTPKLTGDAAAQINQLSAALNKQGGAAKVRRMAFALAESNNTASFDKALRGTALQLTADIISELWYFNLLSGLSTHAVNVTSTANNLLWNVPARALSAQFNRVIRNPQGVQPGEAAEMLYGFFSGMGDGLRAARKAWQTGKPSDVFTKLEDVPVPAITAEHLGLSGVLGKVVDAIGTLYRMPTRALLAEDEFFKTINKIMELRALGLREGKVQGLAGKELAEFIENTVRNPDQYKLNTAVDAARYSTFTSELGSVGRGIQQWLSAPNAGMRLMGRLLMPFIRTPANVSKQMVHNSPLAVLSGKYWSDVAAGGARAQMAQARLMLGTAVIMTTVHQTLNGNITGYGPVDPELRSTWLANNKPFSIRIPTEAVNFADGLGMTVEKTQDGSSWISYSRLDPVGMILGTVASATEGFGMYPAEEWGDTILQTGLAMSKTTFDKTFFTGITGAIEFFSDPMGQGGKQWLERQAGSLVVPAFVTGVTRTIDPIWHEVDGMWEAVKSRTIGYSRTLPPRRNIAGHKIYATTLGPDIISPFYTFTPVNPETEPFFNWAMDNEVPLQMPSKVQWGEDENGGIELTPWEYDRFIQLAGNGAKDPVYGLGWYDTMNAIILGRHPLSGDWARATDGPNGGKAAMTQGLAQMFRSFAKAQLEQESRDGSLYRDFPDFATLALDTSVTVDRGPMPENGPIFHRLANSRKQKIINRTGVNIGVQ